MVYRYLMCYWDGYGWYVVLNLDLRGFIFIICFKVISVKYMNINISILILILKYIKIFILFYLSFVFVSWF